MSENWAARGVEEIRQSKIDQDMYIYVEDGVVQAKTAGNKDWRVELE